MKKQLLYSRNVSCGSKIRGGQLSSGDDFDYLENLRDKKRRRKTNYRTSSPPHSQGFAEDLKQVEPDSLCSKVYNELGFKPNTRQPLGQGESGFVYKIPSRPDLVMKEQAVGTPELLTDFQNEVRALTELQNVTVTYRGRTWHIVPKVEASGICKEASMLASDGYSKLGYIVMEKLQPVREMTREWKDKAYAVLEIAKSEGCLQVDVKKDNFMNNQNGDPVLIDWGWGWCSGWGEPNSQTYTHNYMNLRDQGFGGLTKWQNENVYNLLN
jgi:hypothetical protein